MVEKFSELYGSKTLEDIKTDNDENVQTFYDFPTLEQLYVKLPCMESDLRDAGFGYRAKYIKQTVEALWKNYDMFGGGECWLEHLRSVPSAEAREALMRLSGVGPKVADCVCLMALSKHEVVPVDTHMLQITTQIYKPSFLGNQKKNFSQALFQQIRNFYIGIFGDYAGWAQSVLFSTRLKHL